MKKENEEGDEEEDEGEEEGESSNNNNNDGFGPRPLSGEVKEINFIMEHLGVEAKMEPMYHIHYKDGSSEKRFTCEVEVRLSITILITITHSISINILCMIKLYYYLVK
jgi:hypothetical protein